MKTAISIPDEVFKEAEALAKKMKTSRSELYSRALKRFIAEHDADSITETMNRVCESVGQECDPFVKEASRRIMSKVEW